MLKSSEVGSVSQNMRLTRGGQGRRGCQCSGTSAHRRARVPVLSPALGLQGPFQPHSTCLQGSAELSLPPAPLPPPTLPAPHPRFTSPPAAPTQPLHVPPTASPIFPEACFHLCLHLWTTTSLVYSCNTTHSALLRASCRPWLRAYRGEQTWLTPQGGQQGHSEKTWVGN